jgi:hypothetical protein
MRQITIKSIIEQIKLEANLEYSSFTSDTQITMLLNKSYRNLYNILIGSLESYRYTEIDIAVVNQELALPTDFFKLLTVTDPRDSSTNYYKEVSVLEFTLNQTLIHPYIGSFILVGNKLKFNTRNSPSLIRIRYIPQADTLVQEVYSVSTGVLGGLTFTSIPTGASADEITVEFTSGATAGSEVVTVTDSAISIQIEDGVSTSLQIQTAIVASTSASALVTCSYNTSTQESTGSVTLSGGVTDGTVDLLANEDNYLVADVCKMLSRRSEEDFKVWQEEANTALEMILRTIVPQNIGNNKKVTDVTSRRLFDRGRI